MNVLVINSGSSSIKYQLFSMPEAKVLAKGLLEKIGEETSALKHTAVEKNKEKKLEQRVANHKDGMALIFSLLTDKDVGVISDMKEISGVGHRVVHGGEAFNKSSLLTDDAVKEIEKYSDLSPLHNPAGLQGIRACQEILQKILKWFYVLTQVFIKRFQSMLIYTLFRMNITTNIKFAATVFMEHLINMFTESFAKLQINLTRMS